MIPPPVVFALPLLAGIYLTRRSPLLELSAEARVLSGWIGMVSIAIGAGHMFTSLALFARSRTTIIPHHRSSTFVTRGAYRWTRNPMYVGMTLVCLGLAAITGSVWSLLFLPLSVIVIDRGVIPMEEQQLEETFGAAYLEYKSRVRRWL
jgi:protein-S-isoprenylcysteine O-methyltransferase Ste14